MICLKGNLTKFSQNTADSLSPKVSWLQAVYSPH